ncbi:ester cyclase [Rhizobium sp. Leaf384]|uniref:ester cyclase n=1 Tax=Rhizobium sp. Leaf384 TaxID=1736358 RepID=UPI0009E6F8DF|nr:ester cyclase [Rhizobium sp. Leaf384]
MERPDRQSSGGQVRDPGCRDDGNRIVVRSEAQGTPTGAFLGVAESDHAFRIMTIDIHDVQDGRVSRTYHVEDWSRAARQLRGAE